MSTSILSPSFLPSVGVLEMTYACNHRCLFCSSPWYADNNGFDIRPELTVDEWKRTIDTLCRMGVCDIAFTGGEPLLKEGLEEIIRYAGACRAQHIETKGGALVSRLEPPHLHLLTNSKLLTDKVIELCAELSIQLSISLPGIEAFHALTGGDPYNVLKWFKRAKEFGLRTTVGVTVTKTNIHELYETLGEALLAGADTILLNRFMPGGRGIAHAAELSLTAEQVVQMLDTAEEVLQTAKRWGSVGTELPKCLVPNGRYERLNVGTCCSAAVGFFVIDPSGYVRVCNHSEVRLNHISEIDKVKDHPYWRRFVMKDYLPAPCMGCPHMSDCDGGCREAAHIAGGELDSMDPVLGGMPLGVMS